MLQLDLGTGDGETNDQTLTEGQRNALIYPVFADEKWNDVPRINHNLRRLVRTRRRVYRVTLTFEYDYALMPNDRDPEWHLSICSIPAVHLGAVMGLTGIADMQPDPIESLSQDLIDEMIQVSSAQLEGVGIESRKVKGTQTRAYYHFWLPALDCEKNRTYPVILEKFYERRRRENFDGTRAQG